MLENKELVNINEIHKISIDAKPAVDLANSIQITQDNFEKADLTIQRLKTVEKEFERIRKEELKSILEKQKTINNFFKNISSDIIQAKKILIEKVFNYQKLQEKKKQESETQEAENLADSILQGKEPVKQPPAVKKPAVVSSLRKRKTWQFEIINLDKIPMKYIKREINRQAVMRDIQAGRREIPGLKIYQKEMVY